jgi:hypothetical protein
MKTTTKQIKVSVIEQFKQLEGLLDLGDQVTLNVEKCGNSHYVTFTAKNGELYSDNWLINQIGYSPLHRIFKRI